MQGDIAQRLAGADNVLLARQRHLEHQPDRQPVRVVEAAGLGDGVGPHVELACDLVQRLTRLDGVAHEQAAPRCRGARRRARLDAWRSRRCGGRLPGIRVGRGRRGRSGGTGRPGHDQLSAQRQVVGVVQVVRLHQGSGGGAELLRDCPQGVPVGDRVGPSRGRCGDARYGGRRSPGNVAWHAQRLADRQQVGIVEAVQLDQRGRVNTEVVGDVPQCFARLHHVRGRRCRFGQGCQWREHQTQRTRDQCRRAPPRMRHRNRV